MVCKILRNGTRGWLVNRTFHRDNGPAIVRNATHWYQHNRLHRLDGPAVEWSSGDKEYWIDGVPLTEKEWNCYYGM